MHEVNGMVGVSSFLQNTRKLKITEKYSLGRLVKSKATTSAWCDVPQVACCYHHNPSYQKITHNWATLLTDCLSEQLVDIYSVTLIY